MENPHEKALKKELYNGFPVVKSLPKSFKGTHRLINKGKHKGKYHIFESK